MLPTQEWDSNKFSLPKKQAQACNPRPIWLGGGVGMGYPQDWAQFLWAMWMSCESCRSVISRMLGTSSLVPALLHAHPTPRLDFQPARLI